MALFCFNVFRLSYKNRVVGFLYFVDKRRGARQFLLRCGENQEKFKSLIVFLGKNNFAKNACVSMFATAPQNGV